MTPEAGRYLAKGQQCLAHSEAILGIALGDEAEHTSREAYDLKTLADYATRPEAAVPLERAATALAIAQRFVDVVADMLAAEAATPPVEC